MKQPANILLALGIPKALGFAPPKFHTARPSSLLREKATNGDRDETDRSSLSSAKDWLDAAVQSTEDAGGFDESSFLVGILGDLHIDPRKYDEYQEGHDHWVPIFERSKDAHGNVALVSLGDLGESKNCDHNPANPAELFAGTSLCHEMASEFLGSFGVPYEVIGGTLFMLHPEGGKATILYLTIVVVVNTALF